METFNFIASACSIISLLLSIFAVVKVTKISNKINVKNKNKIHNNEVSNNSKIIGGNEGN